MGGRAGGRRQVCVCAGGCVYVYLDLGRLDWVCTSRQGSTSLTQCTYHACASLCLPFTPSSPSIHVPLLLLFLNPPTHPPPYPLSQSRLQQEQERCLHYLDPTSRRPLLQEVRERQRDRKRHSSGCGGNEREGGHICCCCCTRKLGQLAGGWPFDGTHVTISA